MQIFIYGGASSGKSALAERFLCGLDGSRKLYIAAMQPFVKEDFEKVARHRKMRLGKGFETIEQYTCLDEVTIRENSAVLLECLTNLVANEMFSPNAPNPKQAVLSGLASLKKKAKHLIIVSGEVCSDGVEYPPETLAYQRLLAEVNRKAAAQSDICVETVCGIPIFLKGEDLCISCGL